MTTRNLLNTEDASLVAPNFSFYNHLVLSKIFDVNAVTAITVSGDNYYNLLTKEIIFFPKYDFCLKISNYNTTATYEVGINTSPDQDIRVFLTDRNFESFFSLDYTSHQGSPIIVTKGVSQRFEVKIDVSSTCPIETEVVAKDNFEKCVDDRIQEIIGKPLGCVPPWMSPNNPCNWIYPDNFIENEISNFEALYIDIIYGLKKTEIEKKCKKYCSSTTTTVQEGEKFETEHGNQEIQITFNNRVKVTDTVFNYSPFEFIIDVGSSVGLWLGLSVLGLYDLLVLEVQFVQSKAFFRKLNTTIK